MRDSELLQEIKEDLAKQYDYKNFSELLFDNCKTKLTAGAMNGIIEYLVLEFNRREEKKSHNCNKMSDELKDYLTK